MKSTTKRWGMALAMAIALLAGGARAATQFWMLQNVTFDDGGIVTGSFGFDPVSHTVTGWNIRVQGGAAIYFPFTFVPGNSTSVAGSVSVGGPPDYPHYFYFKFHTKFLANDGAEAYRELYFTVPRDLDGTVTSQSLYLADPVTGFRYSYDYGASDERTMVSGSLVLAAAMPSSRVVEVIEFYHAGFDHYFMSADPVEINLLDTGYFTGWTRTGYQFKAYATGSSAGPTMNPVCRYYGLPSAGLDSHFYSASSEECWEVRHFFLAAWQIESDNVFQIDLPDTTTGACPAGTVPVYRVFNQRIDANHRYMTSTVVRTQMEAQGWIREGYGSEATIMCASSL